MNAQRRVSYTGLRTTQVARVDPTRGRSIHLGLATRVHGIHLFKGTPMRIRSSSFLHACLALGVVGVISVGCADEDKNPATVSGGGMSAAGKGGVGNSGAVGDGGEFSTGGNGSGSQAVTYEVPVSGGTVEVMLPSGNSVHFEFPASAQGETITLTPENGESIGWTDGPFAEVIRMEPDGMQFADPIIITPSNKEALVFDFPSTGEK